MNTSFYGHTLPGEPEEKWELLPVHLDEVAELAAEFAGAWGADDWGRQLGLWHDLGKYAVAFQQYMRATHDADAGEYDTDGSTPQPTSAGSGRVDHSTFGAQYAAKHCPSPGYGLILAFCIAAHHGSLADAHVDSVRGTLGYRLKSKSIPPVTLPADLAPPMKLTRSFEIDSTHPWFQLAFFTRMLFSALIDADRTATERFCDKEKSAIRHAPAPTLVQLNEALTAHLGGLAKSADALPINAIRQSVLDDCLAAGDLPPGFFSLNVPTGGGKTLSSMAFALKHAIQHDLRRVIVAIPFTSIIEQNADVYRRAFGDALSDRGLLEHHSNLPESRQTLQSRLAAENWNAPVIVTTNVQLYESLFAAHGRNCRKIHRIARSVIILDEAQTIPLQFLEPTLRALRMLVQDYGCSVVFCTATQPALEQQKDFAIGIPRDLIRPIIRNETALHRSLKRVSVEYIGQVSNDELADRLAQEPAVLCIVNTRPHANKLYTALVDRLGRHEPDCYHLSTFMCAAHRRVVLAEIRKRLHDRLPCRVVSTQLIEAGVDVDFPCVYRACTGFDSIAQAAGRCNRNGKLAVGRVYVFDTDQLPSGGLLRQAADTGRELRSRFADPLLPDAVKAYFSLLYGREKHQWDKEEIMKCFPGSMNGVWELPFRFREAAAKYKLIDEAQSAVLVPYRGGEALIRKLERGHPVDYQFHRDAQPYLVNVRDSDLKKLKQNQVIIEHDSGIFYLANPDAYSASLGLSFNTEGFGLLLQ